MGTSNVEFSILMWMNFGSFCCWIALVLTPSSISDESGNCDLTKL